MGLQEILKAYSDNDKINALSEKIVASGHLRCSIRGMQGSSKAFVLTALYKSTGRSMLVMMPDKESAAYLLNDIENILEEQNQAFHKKSVLFFPTSFKRNKDFSNADSSNVLLRAEVLNKLQKNRKRYIVVSWPDALLEKVVAPSFFEKNTLRIKNGEAVSVDFITEVLTEYQFDRVDFVSEPGQFAVRGGIVDVFSYSNEHPYRIEFFGDSVESLRTFDAATQLSVDRLEHLKIVPDIKNSELSQQRISIGDYLSREVLICADNMRDGAESMQKYFAAVQSYIDHQQNEGLTSEVSEYFTTPGELMEQLKSFHIIESGTHSYFTPDEIIEFDTSPQPSFNKNFSLLLSDLKAHTDAGYENMIFSDSLSQAQRLISILDDIGRDEKHLKYELVKSALHEGFCDHGLKICCYTDHQIFDRYHRFRLKDNFRAREAVSLKEIYNLQPGDYITHIDHGVGRYGGLEKIEVNGKPQEAVRLVYGENDLLYVSIHSLHRISKFVSKDGTPPKLNRLGSNAWNKLKSKTKDKVKDIARDLIKLYAERRATQGYAFAPDNYLQHELEASFIYQDTPDQIKSTADVKKDLEATYPMDRLICGDVGFGKTEVAIRAAFKAVNDSKQVAVLVPTTILALQHYKTFSERLHDFPCRVDYINRFRQASEIKEIKSSLKDGKIDIIIGTHRLISKDIAFKDLGLLVIDEEQKFGVAVKEKLKQIKVHVDTLTLTATPIPRTLQFSLMGARDLSVIQTPPPNRYPVETRLHVFNEDVIRDAINFELSRNGQVFFVHNRVNNIDDIAELIHRICPDVRTVIAHGQMDGGQLEKNMTDFIDGYYDLLVSTTIIESGLDIPNVNTIIINEAHHYGLSDLHQLRGRVGRSNRKAFCYLLAPPMSVLTEEAKKRLRTIEEFSELGSGFNIAMRDLDIRGAGNILGAEQSGFISEIGFEMYQKILDEAISELKQSEFKELYEAEGNRNNFINDCLIETDLEILIPDNYVNNISERLMLYKELDSINDEQRLDAYREMLLDRFGPIPIQTQELLQTVKLRWMGASLGIEKIVLKDKHMKALFISNPESDYFQSETFGHIITYLKENPRFCHMKEINGKLAIVTGNIHKISDALMQLQVLVSDKKS